MSWRKHQDRRGERRQDAPEGFQQRPFFPFRSAATNDYWSVGTNRMAQLLHEPGRRTWPDIKLQIAAYLHAVVCGADLTQTAAVFFCLRQKQIDLRQYRSKEPTEA